MPAWTIVYVSLFLPLASFTLVVALRWGGNVEAKAALACVLATDLQKLLQGRHGGMFDNLEFAVLVIDLTLFATLTALAVRQPRKWLVCAAALQLLVFSGHIAKMLDPHLSRLAYAILMGSGGYPSQILLLIGIGSAWTRGRNSRPRRLDHLH